MTRRADDQAAMRLFELHRDADLHGNSGTGIVAQGVEFDSGYIAYLVVPPPDSDLRDLDARRGRTPQSRGPDQSRLD